MPPAAWWMRPGRDEMAPVGAPFSWPNSSDSSNASGRAAQLTATNGQGAIAVVSVKNNGAADNNNDVCQLTVAGQSVGGSFGCRGNFTTVEWKDITGDGVPDIVAIAFSAGDPVDSKGNSLADDHCMHQRLLASQWDGQPATPIANVAGCVMREDLYGVRLADVDGDGKLEIEAAPNGKKELADLKAIGTKLEKDAATVKNGPDSDRMKAIADIIKQTGAAKM